MKLPYVSIFLLLASTLSADITNVVDIAALAACRAGSTNGWALTGIDSYTDKTSIRLRDETDYLISPEFGYPIRRIELLMKSSSTSGRKLTFFPLYRGTFDAEVSRSCAYSPNKETYVPQTIDFTAMPSAECFKIAYDDPKNGSTAWGISEMLVITGEKPFLFAPKDVTAVKIRATDATIRWLSSPSATSNIVEVYSISHIPESYHIITNYDFSLCINTGPRDTQDRFEDFHNLYPDFTAEKIYYPAMSTGIVRIATQDNCGRLTHRGFSDYSGMAMRITAKRYAGDKTPDIRAYYVDDSSNTNTIGTISIGDDFSTGIIRLDNVPGGKSISLNSPGTNKSTKRFIVDEIEFLNDYVAEQTTTNLVREISAPTSQLRIDNLSEETEYLIRIQSFDANGNPSEFSQPLILKTRKRDPGSVILLR